MTLFAFIQSDDITQVGALPRLWHDGTRWWDFRPDPDPALLASLGWHEVALTPRPADTDTTGKTWESLTPANVWPPSVSGWREVVAEGLAAWVQPTAAHDAYKVGDKVTHNGRRWTSTVDGNVWPPGTGALWTDDGPV